MKEKRVISWVKAHRTDLLIIGGVALSAVGTVILFKCWEANKTPMTTDTVGMPYQPVASANSVSEVLQEERNSITRVINVPQHVRNLPKGHFPSKEKILEASKAGIELTSSQTIVSAYPRRYAA